MTTVNFQYPDVNFLKRIQYTIDFINNHPLNPGIECSLNNRDAQIQISCTPSSKADYYMKKDGSFLTHHIVDQNPHNNLYTYNNAKLSAVESTINKNEFPFFSNSTFNFDIINTIFFHISRYEEYVVVDGHRNEWDTMIEKNQFLIKHKLEKSPVVDQILHAFFEILSGKKIQIDSTLTVTHDIDHIQKFNSRLSIVKKVIGFILRRGTFRRISKLIEDYNAFYKCQSNDPYNNFDWLLTSKKGIQKKIYFLVGGKHEVDSPFSLEHPTFLNAIQLAKEKGYSVGIHPSYNSWVNESIVKDEKGKLEELIKEQINISRQHYLHFDLTITPNILIQNGIREDSTLGYNRFIGFRCGTGISLCIV